MRKALFQVHLWVGLGLGLYLFTMGVSGAILVFHEEIEHAVHADLFHVADTGVPLPISQILNAGKEAYPGRPITALYVPNQKCDTYMLYVRDKEGERVTYAYFHPVTGRLLGDTHPNHSLVRWLQDLHFNLFTGRTGRAVNGVGGLFLALLCLTGAVLWWPGVTRWARALRVDFRTSWKRLNWDLHGASGMWAVVLLSMWALTGAYFGFAVPVRNFIHSLSPLSYIEPPQSKGTGPKVAVEELIAQARTLSPHAQFAGFQIPAGKKTAWVIYMARGEAGDQQNTDYLYFDPAGGALLQKWERGISYSFGDTIIKWIVPLHFGSFGGIGLKILWALIGLTPPLLFFTGSLMWWNRVGRKRWAGLVSEASVPRQVT